MHLWNSCPRSMSTWAIRYPPGGFGAGVKAGIALATSKLNETSVTRSRTTGKPRIGETVISPGGRALIRVMHMRRGRPFTSAEQEPHLPALQFQRTARSGAVLAWMRWTTSRTTSPSWAGRR